LQSKKVLFAVKESFIEGSIAIKNDNGKAG